MFAKQNMSSSESSIDLKEYKKIEQLKGGKTNEVWVWKHKQTNHQIVVKKPIRLEHADNLQLIEHNIRSINSYFPGEAKAWPVKDNPDVFAMAYFDGKPITEEELKSIEVLHSNGTFFTMLDPNEGNYLKLDDMIIPIDHDYLINHNDAELLSYQKGYLNDRKLSAIRQGASEEEAIEHVLDSYPISRMRLNELWLNPLSLKKNAIPQQSLPITSGKNNNNIISIEEEIILQEEVPNNQRICSPTFKKALERLKPNNKGVLSALNTLNQNLNPENKADQQIATCFTQLIDKINKVNANTSLSSAKRSKLLKDTIVNAFYNLDKKLTSSVKPAITALVCGLIVGLIGLVSGAVIGAAATAWGGGFGGVAAAAAGAAVGFKAGMAIGGIAGTLTGAGIGFFNHKEALIEKTIKTTQKNDFVRAAQRELIRNYQP
ncbi:MAG: hypothetical protein WC785_07975 [Tatlockia sp.]|jgi:hypothetical protein